MATTTVLLTAMAPIAVAQDDEASAMDASWRCVPGEDKDAIAVTIDDETYYVREYGTLLAHVVEVWQETNGERGLQLTKGMSCVGKPDRFVRSACVGLCPIVF